MDYPEEVLTKSKKGKVEARVLIDHGTFVRYEYIDPETGERSEDKVKLILKAGDDYEEYFVIPLKQKNRYLMLRSSKKPDRGIWDRMHGKIVNLYELLSLR